MGIEILIPVLGRPHSIAPLVASIHETTRAEHRIIFLCSQEDLATRACLQTGERTEIVDWAPGRADYARKMQLGFDLTDGAHVFLGATDIEFQAGWDEQVLSYDKGVVGTNDQANASVRRGLFSTHCLVSRAYVEDPGASADGPSTLFHLGYDHNFVDRELCGLAQARGEWAFARHAIVRHRHPLFGTAPDDDTYRKSLRNFHRDQQLFYRRAAQWGYVGLQPQERRLARGRVRAGR